VRNRKTLETGVIRNAKKTAVSLLCAISLASFSMGAGAIGLGKLKVHSALDEPLNAEIPFTSITSKERRKLKAILASRGEFADAGIDRPAHLANIKFSVAKRVDGSYFLQLQTDTPFGDPFLHLLVRIEWAGGRLIREYSALIDPPYLVASKPSGVAAPIIVPAEEPVAPKSEPVSDQWQPTAPKGAGGAIDIPADTGMEPIGVPAESAKSGKPGMEPIGVPAEPVAAAEPVKETLPPAPEPVQFDSGAEAIGAEPLAQAEAMPDFPDYFGPTRVDNSRYEIDPKTGWPVNPEETELADAMSESARTANRGKVVPTSGGSFGQLAPGSDYRVARGDTMWEIAEKVRGSRSDIGVEQVVMAIYQANQGAFFDRNVNNLSAGRILSIPDEGSLAGGPVKQARKEFRAHYDVWQEYRLKAASAQQTIDVAEAPKPAPVTPKAKPQPKAKAKPEPEKAPEKAKPVVAEKPVEKAIPADDLLRIVRSDIDQEKSKGKAQAPDSESRSAKAEKNELADRVASLEESLESKQMQTREAAERAGKVKENLQTQKRLMELENESLAKTEAGKPAKPVDTPKPAEPVKPEEPKKPAPKRVAKTQPPAPVEQPSFIEDLVNSFLGGGINTYIIIGSVVFLIFGLGGVVWRRRRAASLEFEESILNSTMDSDMETTGDTGSDSDSGDTSFLSDFSQGGMGNISTDEVDPIAEAEVYLAYGRDEQAEEILREAVIKDPSRHEVREKLLHIYHQRGDVSAFETVAEELYAALEGRGGKLWDRVAEMGKKLNPDNPMFTGGAPVQAAAAAAAAGGAMAAGAAAGSGDLDDLLSGDDDLFAVPSETPATQMIAGDVEETLFDAGDLDIGTDLDMSGDDGGLDFNIDMGSAEDSGGISGSETVVADDGGLDFSLEDDSTTGSSANELSFDDGALDFSLETDSGSNDDSNSGDGLSFDGSGLDFSLEDSGLEDSSADEAELDFGFKDQSGSEAGGLSLDDGGLDFGLDADDSGTLDMSDEDSGSLDFSLEDTGSSDLDAEEDLETALDTGGLDFSVEPGGGGGDLDFGDAADGLDVDSGADTALATAESEDSQQWDETATKLDLAKAYIDMGDADGARSILDEVLAEGNASQKQQAEDLLLQID